MVVGGYLVTGLLTTCYFSLWAVLRLDLDHRQR